MSQESIENLVRGILKEMNGATVSTNENPVTASSGATVRDYPIAQKHPEWIKTKTGKTLDDITLANVLNGNLIAEDLKITPEILRAQGEIATSAGRQTISRNFERAAELTKVPDERVLEMYNALRPYRSSKAELLAIADELLNQYGATVTSGFVREAAEQYEKRKKLKGDN
jgi:propanediol dehydratase small subunit